MLHLKSPIFDIFSMLYKYKIHKNLQVLINHRGKHKTRYLIKTFRMTPAKNTFLNHIKPDLLGSLKQTPF